MAIVISSRGASLLWDIDHPWQYEDGEAAVLRWGQSTYSGVTCGSPPQFEGAGERHTALKSTKTAMAVAKTS